jgi:hypothetical protein
MSKKIPYNSRSWHVPSTECGTTSQAQNIKQIFEKWGVIKVFGNGTNTSQSHSEEVRNRFNLGNRWYL